MRSADVLVIVAYFSAIIWAGMAFRGRKPDVDAYFTGKGGFPGWIGMTVVGLSIVATLFSGLSFVIYPSVAYSHGAAIVLGAMGMPIVWFTLRYWFLPRYLASDDRHPYDIIERRFGASVRLCISAMFILMRIGWMGVMLAAPALILTGAGILGPEWFWPAILAIGLTCTLYTTIGGIRSVIYTDAIQFLVMVTGGLFIIGVITAKLDLPPAEMVTELYSNGRLDIFDFSLSLTRPFTFWGVLIGLTAGSLSSKVGDLMMLQRYLAAENPRAAARAVAVSIGGAMGMIFTLVVIGLLLWIWYRHNPDPLIPERADQVLSHFIAQQLPAGMSGVLIAALLSATMSSMTSGIIALAGTISNDWVARFGRPRSPEEMFILGRRLSIAVGILATISSGLSSQLGTLFQASQKILGVFLGPMLGCMILVISFRQARPACVLVGMACGTIAGWFVAASPLAVVWVTPIAALATLVVPLLTLRRPSGSAREAGALVRGGAP